MLKDLNLKITYGIRSGFNEAFVINEEIKNELLSRDKNNLKIIKPLLRGRDLNKYSFCFSNLYIIISKYKGNEELYNEYPTVFDYLSKYENELKNRGQVKANSHHWIELDNSPTKEYLQQFEVPKIIWIVLSDKGKFSYDENNFYTNDSCFIMSGKNLKYLTTILNSKLGEWYFNQIGTSSGMGTNMWKNIKLSSFLLKKLNKCTLLNPL